MIGALRAEYEVMSMGKIQTVNHCIVSCIVEKDKDKWTAISVRQNIKSLLLSLVFHDLGNIGYNIEKKEHGTAKSCGTRMLGGVGLTTGV